MSRIWNSLYSKNGLAAKEIAEKLIYLEEGEQIPRVSDLAKELALGNGTVQGALKVLKDLHVIRLESRGHLGTYLVKKDLHLLKEIAGVGSLIGAMPLPYSMRYEGLATGLIEVSDHLLKRIDLAYMRGSKQRVDALKSRRYDFIVMSQFAAEEEMKHDEKLEIVLNFGTQTYVSSHKIFFADQEHNKIVDGMRVGIDHTSIDQSNITLLECEGIDVEFVPVNYMQLFDMLLYKEIDLAVWNADENRNTDMFNIGNFHSNKAKQLSTKASTTVVLIEKDRVDVRDSLLQLDLEEVLNIQQQVVNKEKLPHY